MEVLACLLDKADVEFGEKWEFEAYNSTVVLLLLRRTEFYLDFKICIIQRESLKIYFLSAQF